MTIADFLCELNEIMQRDAPLSKDDLLESIVEWDSMSALAVMSMFDLEFGISLTTEQLRGAITIQNLIEFAGEHVGN